MDTISRISSREGNVTNPPFLFPPFCACIWLAAIRFLTLVMDDCREANNSAPDGQRTNGKNKGNRVEKRASHRCGQHAARNKARGTTMLAWLVATFYSFVGTLIVALPAYLKKLNRGNLCSSGVDGLIRLCMAAASFSCIPCTIPHLESLL